MIICFVFEKIGLEMKERYSDAALYGVWIRIMGNQEGGVTNSDGPSDRGRTILPMDK